MRDPLGWLFDLEIFGIKFGLENIRTLLAALDHPERACPVVHVAGTNGKGSVTAMVDAIFRAAGYRSARYTSPHLVDLSERFTIDGRAAERDGMLDAIATVARTVDALQASGALLVPPTFFEATTAVAFELFRRARAEVAVVEVGLGGRLDATCVVEPVVTAITSIALDHQQHLGGTLREIAIEKAGIIKPAVPVVVGELPPDAEAAVVEVAEARGAPFVRAADGSTAAIVEAGADDGQVIRLATPTREYGTFRLALAGAHQVRNAVVAVRLVELCAAAGLTVQPGAVVEGLGRVAWPGRLDVRRLPGGRTLVLDAAHNPAGARALAEYLRQHPRAPLVFAAMRDKDVGGILDELLPVVSDLIVTRASTTRTAEPEAIAAAARARAPGVPVILCPRPDDALAAAWRTSPRVVVAGSIFLLGDVLKEIGRS